MNYEWVKGFYRGQKTKEITALANASIGYYILDGGGAEVTVAFRRAVDSPTPSHLYLLTDDEQRRVDKAYKQRNGTH